MLSVPSLWFPLCLYQDTLPFLKMRCWFTISIFISAIQQSVHVKNTLLLFKNNIFHYVYLQNNNYIHITSTGPCLSILCVVVYYLLTPDSRSIPFSPLYLALMPGLWQLPLSYSRVPVFYFLLWYVPWFIVPPSHLRQVSQYLRSCIFLTRLAQTSWLKHNSASWLVVINCLRRSEARFLWEHRRKRSFLGICYLICIVINRPQAGANTDKNMF